MSIAIISGSHRKKSESGRVGYYLKKRLDDKFNVTNVSLIDLGSQPLPLWLPESERSHETIALVNTFNDVLSEATGFIFISPEWGGMATPAIKNFFLYFSALELGHKPALLVSVSSSIGGVYPISELRASSYKNTYPCYLPDHLILRNVESIFNDDPEKNDSKIHEYLVARSDYCLRILLAYAEALSEVRKKNIIDFQNYPFGM